MYSDGLPVALIDWDSIRPNNPLIEFGAAAWKYVPLGTDGYFAASDFGRPPDLPRRLAAFAAEYGVTDRGSVAWAIQQAKQRSVEAMRYWPIASADAASFLELVATELRWFATEQERLIRLVGS